MKYLLWKLWQNDKGFTLIEMLVVFCLFMIFIVITTGMMVNLIQTVEVHTALIEKNETFLSALDQLKVLVKHGRPLELLQNGYRLRIAMGKNLVEVYPKDTSLLIKHLEASNPILNYCSPTNPPFFLEEDEDGKIQVRISLDFLFYDESSEHLDLQYLSWCEAVEQ
ncbi:MAG: type II secretion system protein [Bacteroidales bacterium]|nr:type II secretion system protein [Bacteroidales bacterium]